MKLQVTLARMTFDTYLGEKWSDKNKEDIIQKEEAQKNHTNLEREKIQAQSHFCMWHFFNS